MKPRNTVSESRQHPMDLESEAHGKQQSDLGAAGWDGALASGELPTAGTIIGGRYRIERELGSGGMGVVVAARHLELGHRVAIKILSLCDAGASKRFVREARICAGLSSDHIVRVFDNGQLPSGTPYMVMEYLQGHDLREFLAGAAISIADAVIIVRQLCSALSEAHAAGIVHRDLKPSNLFRVQRSDGSALIKVLDFGISKISEGPIGQTGSKLTQPGGFIGTQHYASPEQLTSSPSVDFRADIWGAGTILYELLTGALAFPQEHFLACWAAIAEARFTPPSQLRPEIPAELEAIVERCLRVDPNQRFASSEQLADALDAQLAELEPGVSAFDARSRRRDPQSRASRVAAPRGPSTTRSPIGVSARPVRDTRPRRSNPIAAASAVLARSYHALVARRAPRTSPIRGSMTPIALVAALGLAASGLAWDKLQDRFFGAAKAPPVASSEANPATQAPSDATTVQGIRAAPELGAPDPGAADPGAADPGAADPGAADPGAADPGAADPRGAQDPSAAPQNNSARPAPTVVPAPDADSDAIPEVAAASTALRSASSTHVKAAHASRRAGSASRSTHQTAPSASADEAPVAASDTTPGPAHAGDQDRVDRELSDWMQQEPPDGAQATTGSPSARSDVPALRPRERAPAANATDLPSTTGATRPTGPADTAYPYGADSPATPVAYDDSSSQAPAVPVYVGLPRQTVVIERGSPAPGVHIQLRSQRSGHYATPAGSTRSYHETLRSMHPRSDERPRRRSR